MNTEKESLQGIGVSEGVCIGRVSLLERRHIRIPRNHIIRGQEAFEISRIKTALEKSVTQLESIRTRFMEDGVDHQLILEAHELILKDEELLSDTSKLIHAEKINAEWAFSKIIQQIRSMFEDMNDPYLKERRGDIDFVGERVLRNLVGISPELKGVADVGVGSVLIAHDLSPVDVVILSHRRITAIVTEKGSSTSHTAIIARSYFFSQFTISYTNPSIPSLAPALFHPSASPGAPHYFNLFLFPNRFSMRSLVGL